MKYYRSHVIIGQAITHSCQHSIGMDKWNGMSNKSWSEQNLYSDRFRTLYVNSDSVRYYTQPVHAVIISDLTSYAPNRQQPILGLTQE